MSLTDKIKDFYDNCKGCNAGIAVVNNGNVDSAKALVPHGDMLYIFHLAMKKYNRTQYDDLKIIANVIMPSIEIDEIEWNGTTDAIIDAAKGYEGNTVLAICAELPIPVKMKAVGAVIVYTTLYEKEKFAD